MWRARFLWSPVSEGATVSGLPLADGVAADPVPQGLSDADRRFFNQVGGFGSGRELHVSDVSAMVHGLAFLSILQCEVVWRDSALIYHAKDAQFALRQILESSCADPHVGFPFCNLVCSILSSICCIFRDRSCDISKVGWNMSCRPSLAIREVSDAKEATDGLPKVSFLLGSMTSNFSDSKSEENALYVNASAWERVGRVKREEEMVFISMARDATGFVRDFNLVDGLLRGHYFNRWNESMVDATFGNTRNGPSMLRILRRSMYERCKFLELEVGDIPLETGIASIDREPGKPDFGSDFPASQVPAKREASCDANLHVSAADNWLKRKISSNSTSDASGSSNIEPLTELATQDMHKWAADLLSEGIKRVSQRPRLYFKRGKRYLQLGKLSEANIDVELGLKLCSKLLSDYGPEIRARVPHLQGELYHLGAAISIKMLETEPVPLNNVNVCADQLRILKASHLEDLSHLSRPDSDRSASSASALLAHTRRYIRYFETRLGTEAPTKLNAAKVGLSTQPPLDSATNGESSTYEPQPANLPSASVVSPSIATSTTEGSSTQKETVNIAYVPDKACCFGQCDQENREIRQTEQWVETVCVTGCESVCHKKCYRAFKAAAAHGNLCASCGKHPIDGKALFMTVETANDLRAKRDAALRSGLKRRLAKSEVADTTETANAAKGGTSFNPGSSSVCTDKLLASTPLVPTRSPNATSASIPGETKSPASAANFGPSAPSSQLKCALCSKSFNSNRQYLSHTQSKKHIEKVENDRLRNKQTRRANQANWAEKRARFSTAAIWDERNGSRNVAAENLRRNRCVESTLLRRPVQQQATPTLAHFGIVQASAVVSKAIENATAKSGRSTVSLFDLGGHLDMSTYNVADAEAYYLEHWGGLRTFLQNQPNKFWVSSFSFNHPNPDVSLASAVGSSAAGPTHREAPPLPLSRLSEFPTLEQGIMAEFAGGEEALRFEGLQPVSEMRCANVDSEFAMPEGYIEPTLYRAGEGETVCGICFDARGTHDGTHATGCACKALFCESCLSRWQEKNRKGQDIRRMCISCGFDPQFSGIRKG